MSCVLLKLRLPPRSTRTEALVPYPTLCRSVCGMNYTGMVAASFAPAHHVVDAAEVISPTILAMGVGATAFVILVFGLVSAVIDQRISERARLEAERLRRSEQRFRLLVRSEEHTSELQSLMRISYAVFCLKNKK